MTTDPVVLTTADGCALEAESRRPGDAWAAAVLTHPHPRYGGDMHSTVVAALFERLPAAGVAVVRFNFRGVGRSTGTFDHGRGERADVVAAVDALATLAPGLPLVLAGWSFGADVALAVDHPRVDGWCAVAAPLSLVPPDELAAARDPRPVVLAVPEHDQFRPPEAARRAVAGWAATTVLVIPGTDHSVLGGTGAVVDACLGLLGRLAGR